MEEPCSREELRPRRRSAAARPKTTACPREHQKGRQCTTPRQSSRSARRGRPRSGGSPRPRRRPCAGQGRMPQRSPLRSPRTSGIACSRFPVAAWLSKPWTPPPITRRARRPTPRRRWSFLVGASPAAPARSLSRAGRLFLGRWAAITRARAAARLVSPPVARRRARPDALSPAHQNGACAHMRRARPRLALRLPARLERLVVAQPAHAPFCACPCPCVSVSPPPAARRPPPAAWPRWTLR